MIFVAQPYFSPDEEIIANRVKIGAAYCGALLKQGFKCMSPVMFGSTILLHSELPIDFSFWDKLSFSYLAKCDVLHVLTINGWDKSRGVKAEMEYAKKNDMPIIYIDIDRWETEIEKSEIKLKQ
jgi:hypothetical protein